MYKITTAYLITESYLKPTQLEFYVFSINVCIKGLGNCYVKDIEQQQLAQMKK